MINSNKKEKDASWNKCKNHSQFHDGSKHCDLSSIGRTIELTQIIPSVLNIFDHTRFATHISYFFLAIAVKVVASSGKLVHAAMIVAQIAHSDIHSVLARNTATFTITSEAISNSQMLATSLAIFRSICFDVSFPMGTFDLNIIIKNNNSNIAMNISLIESIQKLNSKDSLFTLIFINAKIKTPKNKYIKFLIFGTETSMVSSVGDSFFIIKYQLYNANNDSKKIHSNDDTCWFHRIINIKAVIQSKNTQSLYTNFFWIAIGVAMADIHRIIHKLKIFDQIMFHIDNDPLHWNAAIQDRKSSGADVQIAKIVSQISKSDIWKCFAILTLVLIKWFAENINKYNQIINTIIAIPIDVFYK